MTSRRVAGVGETFWTQSVPSASCERGGRMELRMSSVWEPPVLAPSMGASVPFCCYVGEGKGREIGQRSRRGAVTRGSRVAIRGWAK